MTETGTTTEYGHSLVYDQGQRVDIVSTSVEWTEEAARRLYHQPALLASLVLGLKCADSGDFDAITAWAEEARAAITKAKETQP